MCQRLDIALFGLVKKRLGTKPLFIRSALVTAPTQILDTLLFTFLGLFGILDHLVSIMLISLTIKFLVIACMSPLTLLSKRLIKA